jgi:hypothetical protein
LPPPPALPFSLAFGSSMPRGPRGERRSADVIAAAVKVMRIATGEIEEDYGKAPKRAKGGKRGGKARAAALTPEQRSEIARAAAAARWKKG